MNEENPLVSKIKRMTVPSSQKTLSLKLEDKILIGIGTFFLLNVLVFVYFANSFFKAPSLIDEIRASRNQAQDKVRNDKFERIFVEAKEDIQKLNEAFEENRRRREEAFEKGQRNFETNFQKVQENFKKGPSPHDLIDFTKKDVFDESMETYENAVKERRRYPKKKAP